ncbi:glycosyltransferase [Lysinibacillus sp. NPDC097195]|uniref:glycosyltransferase n=1 Tax=Lysinibacillus sp. NPDC097195 TaxID=3364141 RepID=UPI003804BB6E
MKILFVAQNFQMGGIQKALINTLKEMSVEEQFEIDVFTFGKGELLKDIPPNVHVYVGGLLLQLIATPFYKVKQSKNFWHIILRIVCMVIVRLIGSNHFYALLFKRHRHYKQYHIAISYFNDAPNSYFNQGTNLFVDKFVKADKKFAWIHTDPLRANFSYKSCVKTYQNFDRLICVSEACKQKLQQFLPQYQLKVQVIYNFFPIAEIKEMATQFTPFDKGPIDLLSVGRMDNATKRFDLIPYICKLLKERSSQRFYWRIIGDGPDLHHNQKLALQLGVADVIEFVGECHNPYPFIKQSDVLILTSAYEGYPMVVGEALILETPVITTNFAAAAEQLRDGLNGLITYGDVEEIAIAIASVISDEGNLQKMKKYIEENRYTNQKAQEQLVMEFDR